MSKIIELPFKLAYNGDMYRCRFKRGLSGEASLCPEGLARFWTYPHPISSFVLCFSKDKPSHKQYCEYKKSSFIIGLTFERRTNYVFTDVDDERDSPHMYSVDRALKHIKVPSVGYVWMEYGDGYVNRI